MAMAMAMAMIIIQPRTSMKNFSILRLVAFKRTRFKILILLGFQLVYVDEPSKYEIAVIPSFEH